MSLKTTLHRLVYNESGSTLTEFAVVMSVLTIGTMIAFNTVATGVFSNTNGAQTNMTNSSLVAP